LRPCPVSRSQSLRPGSELGLGLSEQDAQLSQRDRASYGALVLAKTRRLELEDNILRTL